MNQKIKQEVENLFESILWNGRLITLLAVVFSFLSSVALFVAGSKKIFSTVIESFFESSHNVESDSILIDIIGAVDLYLIALVLLIFSFGVYELFVSKIDQARHNKEINILEIKNLDDLKNRLLKVIIMALIVYFFKSILSASFKTPIEILYMGVAILAAAASSIFIKKIE